MKHRILIELSNKTSEIIAENLVAAFKQFYIIPIVYRVHSKGSVELKSGGGEDAQKLSILHQFYPDLYPPPYKGLVGTRLYRAIEKNNWKDSFAAFILFNDGGGHRRVIAEWGRRNGMPVFYVPESAGAVRGLTPSSYFSFKFKTMAMVEQLLFPLGAAVAGEGLIAQYVCAPNHKFAEWIKEVSTCSQTVIVTGSPLYDKVVIKQIPISPPSNKVLFIHQPMIMRSKRYKDFVYAFFALAEKEPYLTLLFKVHPRTTQAELDLIFHLAHSSPNSNRIKVIKIGDVHNILRNIGVVVAGCSTVINDVILSGVPLVLIKKAFGDGIDAYLDEYEAAVPVQYSKELYEAIFKAMFDIQTRSDLNEAVLNRVVPEYFNGLDGKASERIASFVLQKAMLTDLSYVKN